MADIAERLPPRIEAMAKKSKAYATEVVMTDGGHEHRNARRASALSQWTVESPPIRRNTTDYLDAIALHDAALGSLYSFAFHDIETCADVDVRFVEDRIDFDTAGNLAILSFTLAEVLP